jgi:HamA
VHCVHAPTALELWLGEAKFYKSIDKAIDAVMADLEEHLAADYLKTEFALVASKIEDDHPHAQELRRLMHPNTSLDEVFNRIVIPILITYDSASTLAYKRVCIQYATDLEAEIRRIWLRLKNKLGTTLPVDVRLFLVPLGDKAALLEALKKELQKWQ